jgi:hypothetical protein
MQQSMSRRKANGAANEADRIVAERKISSCPDVIVTWLTKNPPDLARAGMETGPLAVWRWTSRQRSADRLHGRPARQCDPGGKSVVRLIDSSRVQLVNLGVMRQLQSYKLRPQRQIPVVVPFVLNEHVPDQDVDSIWTT